MIFRITFALILPLAACTPSTDNSDSGEDSGEQTLPVESTFTAIDNPHSDRSGFGAFTRYVDMNGLSVYGENGISDEKLIYVANIMAELLDNDENGEWDDTALFDKLLEAEMLMPVFAREGSAAENEFFNNYRGDGVSAVLYNREVDPSQPGHWGSDATIEETMHTINHRGHVSLYPEVFGMEPNSSKLTEAMDVARGGQWISHPSSYPEEAWYHYNDRTCDYECMAIEYIYWAQVANMGILDDQQTCNGINDEWELCSPELVQEVDTKVYEILIDTNQPLPLLAPDGIYAP